MTEPTREQIDPARQAAYDAVFQVIAAIPSRAATEYDQVCENGRVWRSVEAALNAFEVAQRPGIVPRVLYDNLRELRDEAREQVKVLEERIRKVRELCAVANGFDMSEPILAVLDGEGEEQQ